MSNLQIIKTSDGSDTLFNSDIQEHYHSINGAYEESLHVFINSGLKHYIENNENSQINIFEVGFGTGLNAILTHNFIKKYNIKINYFTIEKFPLEKKIYEKLNFSNFLDTESQDIFLKIHNLEWNSYPNKISDKFSITKIKSDFIDFQINFKIDILYFDAFSYDKQPEMWSEKIFSNLFKSTNENGILTTYASKGIIKQNLRNSGFIVKRLPGINGKRHIVRAEKKRLEL